MQPGLYTKRPKRIFEATKYYVYYVAADKDDALNKEDVDLTLDRSQMWNCSVLNGSSSCYDFRGLPLQEDGQYRIQKRFLPCPCYNCYNDNYNACLHLNIVATINTSIMKLVNAGDCPDILQVPLNQYSNDILRQFIKRYNNNKVPSQYNIRKETLVHNT